MLHKESDYTMLRSESVVDKTHRCLELSCIQYFSIHTAVTSVLSSRKRLEASTLRQTTMYPSLYRCASERYIQLVDTTLALPLKGELRSI